MIDREAHLRAALEAEGTKALDYAWAAGVLEGEGCFSMHRRSNRRSTIGTAIHCEMTDEDVVRRLHAIFGVGTVVPRANSERGDGRTRKPSWVWSVQNKRGIANVLLRVAPYLGARRLARVDELLDHIETSGALDD